MEKVEFNFEQQYMLNFRYMMRHYPNDSIEQNKIRALEKLPENRNTLMTINVRNKMIESLEYEEQFAINRAQRLMENMPEVLYPNIEEWIDDKPISDLVIGDVSIKRIMEQHKDIDGKIYGFVQCAFLMKDYVNNGCKDSFGCFHHFNRV